MTAATVSRIAWAFRWPLLAVALIAALWGLHRRGVAQEVARVRAVAAADSARAVAAVRDSMARADSARWAVELAARDRRAKASAGRATAAERGWQRLRDSLRTGGLDTGTVGDVAAMADSTIRACSVALTDCQAARVAADSAREVAEDRAARVAVERDSALARLRRVAETGRIVPAPRWGWTVGPSAGVAACVSPGVPARPCVSVGISITWGRRIGGGQ